MLKTKLTLLATFILLSTISFSQISAGVKTALNLNNLSFSESYNPAYTKINTGYVFGGVIEYQVTGFFKIRPEINLTSKGCSYDIEKIWGEGAKGYDRTVLSYLEVPVNLVLNFHGFELTGGGYIALGLSGKDKYDVDDYNGENIKDETKLKPVFGEIDETYDSDKIPFNALDYGLNAGIGYSFGPMIVNVSYLIGLSNVFPKYSGIDSDFGNIKAVNRTVSFSVIYLYGK